MSVQVTQVKVEKTAAEVAELTHQRKLRVSVNKDGETATSVGLLHGEIIQLLLTYQSFLLTSVSYN
jgi:hypothetical protein